MSYFEEGDEILTLRIGKRFSFYLAGVLHSVILGIVRTFNGIDSCIPHYLVEQSVVCDTILNKNKKNHGEKGKGKERGTVGETTVEGGG